MVGKSSDWHEKKCRFLTGERVQTVTDKSKCVTGVSLDERFNLLFRFGEE